MAEQLITGRGHRHSVDLHVADIPHTPNIGRQTYEMVNDKYRAWLKRRGFHGELADIEAGGGYRRYHYGKAKRRDISDDFNTEDV